MRSSFVLTAGLGRGCWPSGGRRERQDRRLRDRLHGHGGRRNPCDRQNVHGARRRIVDADEVLGRGRRERLRRLEARVGRVGPEGGRRDGGRARDRLLLVHHPHLVAEHRREALASPEDVGGEDDHPVGDAEPGLVGAAARGERVDAPAARRVGALRDGEHDAALVLVGDRGEPAPARRVPEDARVGEAVRARAVEVREAGRLHELRRTRVGAPHALGEVDHLDDEAGPGRHLRVGRVVAATGDVGQADDRRRDRCDRQGRHRAARAACGDERRRGHGER